MDDVPDLEALVAALTKELDEHRELGKRDGHGPSWIKRDIELENQLRQAKLDLEVLKPG
jgi:hypothetical protein